MKKLLLLLLLLPTIAQAADNAVTLTPGSGVTMRTKDIGAGVQSPYNILGDVAGAAIYGTAGTANTNVITVQGIASGTAIPVSLSSTTITGTVAATQSGTWNITNISGTISLPTGAATAANQATEIASLATIATNTGAAIPAGSAIIGKVGIDQTTPGTTNLVAAGQNGTWTVQPGNTPNTSAWLIRTVAGATGGGTISSAIAPATPAGVNLKASAGSVFRVFATTIQSTPVYIKLYNASSAPTCGSGTPVARFMVPAASTAANGAGTNIDIGDIGAAFGTGIGYCVTGALADADTTAITANNTLVNIVWN